MIMYGIPNCDTIKKARSFLNENKVSYDFHDYKKQGISESQLRKWCKEKGFDTLLNRRGTTWRKLDQLTKGEINEENAIKLMLEQPSIIKRPVLETGKQILIGFNQSDYESLL